MELNQDFREFFGLLNKNEVRDLIVGGDAVAFHGHPRSTRDIDIWVDATPENAARLGQSLREFGFASWETGGSVPEPAKWR
jgi:tRNA nucleotidyltransferase/poly(A) polymerase